MHPRPVNIEPVNATLEYLQSGSYKPVTYMLAPPAGHAWDTGYYAAMPVIISDGLGKVEGHVADRQQQVGRVPVRSGRIAPDLIRHSSARQLGEQARALLRICGAAERMRRDSGSVPELHGIVMQRPIHAPTRPALGC